MSRSNSPLHRVIRVQLFFTQRLRSAFRKSRSHERCDDVFFTLSSRKFRVIKAERIEAAHYFKVVPKERGIFENYGDARSNYGVAAFKLDIMCQITL